MGKNTRKTLESQRLEDEKLATSLETKRKTIYCRVKSIGKTFKDELSNENSKQFKPMFDRLASLQEKFDEIQAQLVELNTNLPDESKVEIEKIQSEFDDMIHVAEVMFMSLTPQPNEISTQNSPSSSSTKNTSSNVRLPKLDLPEFDGKLEDWRTFYNLFVASIHEDKDLPKVKKFQYLLTSLKGEAKDLVKGLDITDANYDVAWEILSQRFQCERRHIFYHFNGLLDLPEIKELQQIPSFLTKYREHTQALEGLNHKLAEYSSMLTAVMIRKMSFYFKKRFDDFRGTETKYPTVTSLVEFLEKECLTLDGTSAKSTNPKPKPNNPPKQVHLSKTEPAKSSADKPKSYPATKCPLCDENHLLFRCEAFLKKSINDRRALVKSKNLCYNCMRSGHSVAACRCPFSCKSCKERHNSYLHVEKDSSHKSQNHVGTTTSQNSTSGDTSGNVKVHFSNLKPQASTCILGTAVVLMKNEKGKFLPVRGLIDSGAMSTFVTEKCAERLGLALSKDAPAISGLGNQTVSDVKGTIECVIKSRFESQPVFTTTATVMTNITSNMPLNPLPDSVRRPLKGLKLADPEWSKPGPIDLLIGADLYPYIYTGRKIILAEDWPVALDSIYGWVLIGKFNHEETKGPITTLLSVSFQDIDTGLKKLWEIEEVPRKISKKPDDVIAEKIYAEQHYRQPDGRYVVPLLMKETDIDLSDSYHLARSRLLKLEQRFERDPELKEAYKEFMAEYRDLGHMELVNPDSIGQGKYYIPHHGIWKLSSTTTRMRTVFDASMKTRSGKSLNDCQYSGEKLQLDISEILTRFRLQKIAFTTDICKMYRQILIRPEDRIYQRILWRNDPSQEIQEYQLNTVTYGERASPFLSLRTIDQLERDEGHKYPDAAPILKKKVFVDDILGGADTKSQAKKCVNQLTGLAGECKFELKKWASNEPEILEDLPKSSLLDTPLNFSNEDDSISVLGLQWQPSPDTFSYKIDDLPIVYTKRGILSLIFRIFDPLGLITPIVLMAKQFVQQIWLLGLGWDDEVPESTKIQWEKFTNKLPAISQIKAPRYISLLDPASFDLIAFSDGSKKGYGATVYIRVEDKHGNVKVNLLLAKSKVAPLKVLSIPRLELSGAVLMTDLLEFAIKACDEIQIRNLYAFTDSTIVLDWLRTPPYELKVFEANRVVKILETLTPQNWSHVKSKENPADLASRGCEPEKLINNDLWWHGPEWLKLPVEEWPKSNEPIPKTQEGLKELTNEPVVLVQTRKETWNQNFLDSHSKLIRLIRVTAWIFRFIGNCRPKNHLKVKTPLSPDEFKSARNYWIKYTQQSHFKTEIQALKKSKEIPSNLISLKPFIDSEGYLRVGGRLTHSDLTFAAKYPILLPKKSHFTQLVIDSCHKETLHGGPKLTLASLNSKYWVINARQQVRAQILKCVTCFKTKPTSFQPPMGDLPKWRIQEARPFLNTGVDFGGPFTIRENDLRKSRQTKAYLALFICMATKALHLECVSELTKEAFIASLDRFVSRRGLCKNLFSDNGTNFTGANNELKAIYQFLKENANNEEVVNFLTKQEINWHFSPPSGPNFGGLWEAGIKSAKHHIKRVVGTQILTFEEFTTLLSKIEAVLNSRPLCPISTDPSEIGALTPAHFLIGDTMKSLPEHNFDDVKINHLDRWQIIQQASQSFWKIWKNKYINTLRQRSKWLKPAQSLKVGDLVLIQDPDLAPLNWRMGRVTACTPGLDKIVRVADVKTTTGTLRRPVSKLCRLPLPENDQ